MANVTFGDFAADMRLEDDMYGIPPAIAAGEFLAGFVAREWEVLTDTPTLLRMLARDARGATLVTTIEGSRSQSLLSALTLEMADVVLRYEGDFEIDARDDVTGILRSMAVFLNEDGERRVLVKITGIEMPYESEDPDSEMLSGADLIVSGSGSDYLLGYAGNDSVIAGTGDDTLSGNAGDDTLDGGAGADLAGYQDAPAGVTVDLALSTVQQTGGAGQDRLTGIEHALGSAFADVLWGSGDANRIGGDGGNDALGGRSGDDTLHGDDGDDTLAGGLGNDLLLGGGGHDSAVFAGKAASFALGSTGSHHWLVDRTAADGDLGTDHIADIEVLRFADRDLTLSLTGPAVLAEAALHSAIAALPGGGYAFAWTAYDSAHRLQLFIRTSTSEDQPQGAATLVNTPSTRPWSVAPAIAALDDGSVVVAWGTGASDDANSLLRVQRFDSSGRALGEQLRIDDSRGYAETPALAALADGGFVLGWRAPESVGGTKLYARQFDSAGTAGPLLQVAAAGGEANHMGALTLAGLDSGGFVATWYYGYQIDKPISVRARIYGEDGTAGPQFFVTPEGVSAARHVVDVAVLSGGGFVVAWESGSLYPYAHGIDFQVFADDGTPRSPRIAVSDEYVDPYFDPTLTALDDGGFVLAWFTDSAATITAMQAFDAAGSAVGQRAVFEAAARDRNDFYRPTPHVVATSDGGWLLEVPQFAGKVAQRFDRAGNALRDPILTGTGEDDVLRGADGTQILDGAGGADTLEGGVGDDVYVIDQAGDRVMENADGGNDTVRSPFTLSLLELPHIEHLQLLGTDPADAIGNDDANRLEGNAAANLLDGRGGADTMLGGAGDDTYVLAQAGDLVIENAGGGNDTVRSPRTTVLASHAHVENLHLTGSDPVDGFGDDAANRLGGNAAANLLDGRAGADTMDGGAGDDTYIVDDGADLIVETADAGHDTVQSRVGRTLEEHIEDLALLPVAGDARATGNALPNLLVGNAGNNTLDGAGGADTLSGGKGDDTYLTDILGDVVIEGADGGIDTVASLTTRTLGEDQENLLLAGERHSIGTGNALANRMTGSAANNALRGLEGHDTLIGGDGNDTLAGGSGADALAGGAGDDVYAIDSAADTVSEALVRDNRIASEKADGTRITTRGSGGSIAADGQYVAFHADHAYTSHVFVKDMETGAVVHASVTAAGIPASSSSYGKTAISASGRFVAFTSDAANLSANDRNDADDVFLKDIDTGAITRVSSDASGNAGNSSSSLQGMSADGRYVVFTSNAWNLVAGDTNHALDVFVKDVQTGSVTRVGSSGTGAQPNAHSNTAAISADGRFVAFSSLASNLAGTDNNGVADIFLHDLVSGSVQRVSSSVFSARLDGASMDPSISADGRYVAFASHATNLVAGDRNGRIDIFVRDMQTGTLVRVSVAQDGAEANGSSSSPSLSADGRYLGFVSNASNLVGGDTNGVRDVFVKDLLTGEIARVSAEPDGTGGRSTGTTTMIAGNGEHLLLFGPYTLLGSENDGNFSGVVVAANPLADAGGSDRVKSSVSHVLGARLEHLTLTGATAIDGTGNAADNRLTGNEAANVLSGLEGADTLNGAAGADSLYGATGADVLRGGRGTDQLFGGFGDDTLAGGAGSDTLTGGPGSDRFLFDAPLSATGNVDRVGDFTSGTDLIALDDGVFAAFDAAASALLGAAQFTSGAGLSAAQEAGQRIVCDTSTGTLYYDPDGPGGRAAIPFAMLDTAVAATLAAGDFLIVD